MKRVFDHETISDNAKQIINRIRNEVNVNGSLAMFCTDRFDSIVFTAYNKKLINDHDLHYIIDLFSEV